jgi:DNA polymerase elongation subunit (family B)
LDNIAKHYLDIHKIDLKPWEMFAKFKEIDPKGRTDIAEYCVRDCELPIKLVHKMNQLNGLIEFSKVTHVPIDWLLLRGQQIRVYSLISKAARDKDFLVPDMQNSGGDDLGFTGAVVLDPKSGGYTEDIICAMDFASLYPSIMMAHRMCGSTLVIDQKYAHIPGIEYYEVEAAPGLKVRFAQTDDNVIPGLLYELKALRKQAKKDMEAADTDFTKGLLNSRQLAYKLVMNSLYGALGSNHGLLCGLKKISMSVTATGRWMIHETKRLVEELNPGSKVVYGDSVAAWTPITIRYNGQMEMVTFEELATRVTWTPRSDGKEYAHHDGHLDIWSDKGWTPVNAIIRHTHTDPLVRVATHTGVVDVTKHHSLVRPNGEVVKPSEVSIGDDLMHADGPHIPSEMLESLATHTITGHLEAATMFRALRSAGYAVSITSSIGDTYTLSTQPLDDNKTCIQSMTPIPYNGYVYDVTTGNHHFAAGVGDLIVHNTDSVLCILNCGEENRQNLKEHFRVAEDLADQITKHFLPPHELEMEKAYFPYLLVRVCLYEESKTCVLIDFF